ncbi:MAG TPA: hypothetical protein VJB14_16200 [Planctomycetota bacterium]|nr:hypothetical protein [Planctomycetota bacterium]
MIHPTAVLLPLVALSCLAAPAGSRGTRLTVEVSAAGVERHDRPVEVEVQVKDGPGVSVAEVNRKGEVLDGSVPCQFDHGTLVFLMKGTTAADATRFYRATFGEAAPVTPLVTATDDVPFRGQAGIKIATPSATYHYHKAGAGFAAMEDRDGNDWLGYQPSGGSAGNYRGIPNAVHPEGHFHPGGTTCTSTLVSRGPIRARILSESNDRKWACAWDIFPGSARLTVLRKDKPYWFLYEGTPGGKLDPEKDYVVRSNGERSSAAAKWTGDIAGPEWLYFGDGKLDRVLFLAHHEEDEKVDSYWPMEGNMTVFGFGRDGLTKHLDTVPQRFTVGFRETSDFAGVSKEVRSSTRDLVVKVAAR